MKPAQFHVPNALFVERSLHKDGPSPVYVAWKPHTSRLFYDKKSLLKFCAWPKSLPTGQALRDWLDSFDDQPSAPNEHNQDRIAAEGFGPEAHLDESDPNHQTKTVI